MVEYKVLLTTSGIGSRLGELTNYTNKSLVRINNKPTISHIVEHYSEDVEFVVTLGYYGSHVKEFLQLAYPDRKFIFVDVNNYNGPGSSLGYSMLNAQKHLQCPFVFHACDTIINYKITDEWVLKKSNWVMSNKRNNVDQFRTIQYGQGDWLARFKDKGEYGLGSGDAYIGVCGVYDYTEFWNSMEELYTNHPNNTGLSDCHAINNMIQNGKRFWVIDVADWYDIGNTSELARTRKELNTGFQILDKVDESIFMFEDSVIKFFYDKQVVEDRITRARLIPGTPKITGMGTNFFKYEKAKGNLYARSVTETNFRRFLEYMQDTIWKPIEATDFKADCYRFYRDKTLDRITQYSTKNFATPNIKFINGMKCLSPISILNHIDMDWLTDGIPCNFHGDCILDNVIENNGEFTLIDWRQNFNGKLYGDVYYDLAKLNHNLTFNHDLVNKDMFTIKGSDNGWEVDILTSNKLQACQDTLHKFIVDNGYDLTKVKLLTAIIWINMAPLHHGELGNFLMNFGQWHLNRIYKEIKNEQNIKKSSRVNQH